MLKSQISPIFHLTTDIIVNIILVTIKKGVYPMREDIKNEFDSEEEYSTDIITLVDELVRNYNDNPNPENYLKVLYNIPVGFRLTARMTTNYRQLKTIYNQRLTHRLPEWRAFCKQLEELPLFMDLCFNKSV